MPRWKQRFVCLACAHSSWREVITESFEPAPQPAQLMERGFYCSMCEARRYLVVQTELIGGRWADAFKPGGLRGGAVTFGLSAEVDAEVAKARGKIQQTCRRP